MKARMHWLLKTAVGLGSVGAAAGLLVITRPGPRGYAPTPPAADAARAEQPGRASSVTPARSLPTYRAPVAAAGAGAGAGSNAALDPSASGSAPSADVRAFREHGRQAVLRTPGGIEAAFRPIDRAKSEPLWDSPTELKFVHLKEHYRAFRKQADFAPDIVTKLHGAAAIIAGAVMPIDPITDSGEMKRFWLANPIIVMAGCVFCNPPTMGDLVYVRAQEHPIQVDPEKLFRGVVTLRVLGRLELGPQRSEDGVEYLFGLELRSELE
jgi:hypothetical protein